MAKNHKTEAIHIGKAIQEMLKTQHLKPKFDEANVIASWETLVGKAIARRTRRINIRNKVLFVELVSPSMKQDLTYHKNHMLEVFKKEFGEGVVTEIIFM
jgi:predicted nucleic acid-binding Zn ribbon protein